MAAALGARYVGVIFAGGARELTAARAAEVLSAAGPGVQRVGVFGTADVNRIAPVADVAALNVIQIHSDPTRAHIAAVQKGTGRAVWAVIRIADGEVPASAEMLFAAAQAVVLDAKVAGHLGGTGVTLPWASLAPSLRMARRGAMMVLAGGLTAVNVSEAIDALDPSIVDVSSGVESAPGVKDHQKMRAFAEAVWKQR
jgi:phosphoribosylanthranilate isomerase